MQFSLRFLLVLTGVWAVLIAGNLRIDTSGYVKVLSPPVANGVCTRNESYRAGFPFTYVTMSVTVPHAEHGKTRCPSKYTIHSSGIIGNAVFAMIIPLLAGGVAQTVPIWLRSYRKLRAESKELDRLLAG